MSEPTPAPKPDPDLETDSDEPEEETDTETESSDRPCALCSARVPNEDIRYVNDQPACLACVNQVRAEIAEQQPEPKHYAISGLGGLVGAILGAAVWAGVAIITEFEVGYIAVLVGFLAGLGVRVAAGKKRSLGMQIMASVLSIVGLLIAKYMILAYVVVDLAAGEGVDLSYFDPRIFEVFPQMVKETLSPFDALWLILAVGAAYRVPQPSTVTIHA